MKAHNKRMQSDQSARYARTLAADARRYDRYLPKADIRDLFLVIHKQLCIFQF